MRSFLFLLVLLVSACVSPAQRFVKTVNSWADLLSLNPNDVHTNAFVNYGFTVDDTLGGIFTYYSTATDNTNDATVLKPYSYNGRWMKRMGAGISNYYATNIYGSNIYATNLYVGNVVSNFFSLETNITVNVITVESNAVYNTTNITVVGRRVTMYDFDPNQFNVAPSGHPAVYDVAIKSGATTTNFESFNRLLARNTFAMGANVSSQGATAATNSITTADSSWVDIQSNSAVPGARVIELDTGTYNGQMLVLRNLPGGETVLLPNSSSVVGGGQVNLAGVDWQAKPSEAILLIYDEAFQDWNEIGRFGSGTTAGIVANLTPGYIPYATSTNTLGDSPLYRASASVIGLGSVNRFIHGNLASGNAFYGHDSGSTTTTGLGLVGVGVRAVASVTSGNQNVGIGQDALRNVTTGGQNVGIGTLSLTSVTNQFQNTGVGDYSLYYTTGGFNTALGASAGFTNTTGTTNVFIGVKANPQNATDSNTIVIGGHAVGAGSNSAAIGNTNVSSLYIGKVGKVGFQFVALGQDAMKNSTSVSSIGIGDQSLGGGSATGNGNTGVGFYTLRAVTDGEGNTAVGNNSLYKVTSGDNNAGLGGGTLLNLTTGSYNVGVGNNAGQDLTTGSYNIFIGSYAGQNVETGDANVAIGRNALGSWGFGVTSSYNTAVGDFAMTGNTNSYNTALGASAGVNSRNSTGFTAIGYSTGPDEANYGVYVGNNAGAIDNSTIGYNTFVGYHSGLVNTNDSYNTFLGALTGTQTGPSGTVTNSIAIGVGVNVTNNNEIVIGNSSHTKAIFPITSFSGAGSKFLSDDGKYRAAYSILTGNYTDWDYFIPTNYHSGNIAAGNTTILTVPAGKRLLITAIQAGTTNTSGVYLYPQILTNSIYYRAFVGQTVTTNAIGGLMQFGFPMLLTENESLAINASADGGNVWAHGFLMSANSPLKPIRAFNLGIGNNTVYTVPAGYYAAAPFNNGVSTFPTGIQGMIVNDSGGARAIAEYVVPSGSSADGTTIVFNRSLSDDNSTTFGGFSLSEGGTIVISSDSAAAGQHVWGAVVEVPVP